MATAYKDIQFSVSGRVAPITLARPPLNLLTISMMKEMTGAIQRIGAGRDICAIVFSAAANSPVFSAGVSVEEHRPETVYQMLEAFHSIFRSLIVLSKPVIAIVNGAALGGGCELVAFADIVIAAQTARFGQPEIKLGVFPPVSSVILPRIIGQKKALEMILTGELITADEARSLGLVNYVVGQGDLEAKAEEVLNMLRHMSAPALEMARQAIYRTESLPFEDALKKAEEVYLNDLMSLKDPIEGIEAFIEKRQANWKHK